MEEFWVRVKTLIKNQNTTMEWVASQVGVRPDSFRRWSQRKTIPNALFAVKIARALDASVEYLATGREPIFLSGEDMAILNRAKKWQSVLLDLESLSPALAESFKASIHVAAEEARGATVDESSSTQTKGA